MADDFQSGDVVVCVKSDGRYLRDRAVYRLTAVFSYGFDVGVQVDGLDCARLGFDGIYAWRFRKLPKADDSFAEQMRKLKPTHDRVPA